MNRKGKKRLWILLALIVLIAAAGMVWHWTQQERYASDNPLYGSFVIMDKETGSEIYPADFLISIDVAASNEALAEKAVRNQVDLSAEPWVYCYAEDKVFPAEYQKTEQSETVSVCENGEVVGTFTCTQQKIAGIPFHTAYQGTWRGQKLTLKRTLQGFVFPT